MSEETLPNYTTQSGNIYKGNIDNLIARMAAIGTAFTPKEQSTPDMTVRLDEGRVFRRDTNALTEVAAQNTGTITAPSGNPRNDIVCINELTGAVSVITGTEAASPTDPAITDGLLPVARISLDNSPATTTITNSIIDDIRELSGLGEVAAGTTDTEARDVNTMQAWKLAELEGTGPLAMVNTISDAFEDETGVDTGTSTNETYDATDDYYHNIAADVAIAQATGTTIGDMTTGGGIAAAYDSNESQTQTQGARSAIGASAVIGKDFGVSNDKVIKEVTCIGSSDQGFVAAVYTSSLTIDVYGTTDGGTSGGTLIGTTGSFSNVTGPITKVIDCSANTTAYRGYYATVGAVASKQICFAEVKAEEDGTVLNMTLVSNVFTAASAPGELRGLVDIEEGDSLTINTDATLEVTADGSTWQALTLVEVSAASATRKTYAATVTSGFGTGTTPKLRFKTLNEKQMILHAWGLQADVELSV